MFKVGDRVELNTPHAPWSEHNGATGVVRTDGFSYFSVDWDDSAAHKILGKYVYDRKDLILVRVMKVGDWVEYTGELEWLQGEVASVKEVTTYTVRVTPEYRKPWVGLAPYWMKEDFTLLPDVTVIDFYND